ncbi:MAG: hypothetical protein AB7P20_03045 [Rhizobiaceae bacterium]
MNYYYDPKENDRLVEARESFSARLLSDAQFDEAIVITGIVEREIKKSGSFKEKLADYAYAFARTESFDAAKSEGILRDLFKARTGQTMNQMREQLAEREEKLTPVQKRGAYQYAEAVGEMIQNGDKISFYRAYAHCGKAFAEDLGITHAGAKRLIKEEFQAAGKGDFYEWGKAIEEQFYRPQVEAERKQREERAERREADSGDREERSSFQRDASSSSRGNGRSRMQYRR